jgi:hypothetical protein
MTEKAYWKGIHKSIIFQINFEDVFIAVTDINLLHVQNLRQS